jgi:1-phosphofructokinase family hexose kinase
VTPLVLSLNPAVDAEWRVREVVPEEKNELVDERRWPGGKGVNVARWLKWLGTEARLFLPLGGVTGDELAAGLRSEKIRFTRFRLGQPTRVNVVVTPDTGPQYRFNPSWPRVGRAEAARLLSAATALAMRSDPVVVSGTLAFGAPSDTYAKLVRCAREAGRRVFLDCDREPFALAAECRPFLVKPNESELVQWAGRPLRTEASLRRAVTALSVRTGGWVLLSRGENGAWLRNAGQGVWLSADAPRVTPRNQVGAGDALLAGAVASVARSDDPAVWLRQAVATGTAATQVPPGCTPSRKVWRDLLAAVRVTPL